nr:glycosyltransferase [Ferrimicrobium acidiphilum]
MVLAEVGDHLTNPAALPPELSLRRTREEDPNGISVVIPTKNCAKSLRRLLLCLQAQKTPCREVIVVDGGSTDSTREVAVQYGARFKSSSHMAAAKNAGFRAAAGSVILFLDSDMEVGPGFIQSCLSTIESCDAACIREIVTTDNVWGKARGWEKQCYFGSLIFEAARLFRLKTLTDLGGYDERYLNSIEDIELQARLVASGHRIGRVSDPIVHHEEGLGFFNYIEKRRGRGFYDFAVRHPEYWKEFMSPFLRVRYQWKEFLANPSLSVVAYVVSLNFLRLTEWAVRTRPQ